MNADPYLDNDEWYIDHDPDDEEYIYGDVTAKLADLGATATGVVALVSTGITIMEEADIIDGIAQVKLTGHDNTDGAENFLTFRVSYLLPGGKTGRFDRTTKFRKREG